MGKRGPKYEIMDLGEINWKLRDIDIALRRLQIILNKYYKNNFLLKLAHNRIAKARRQITIAMNLVAEALERGSG